MCHNPSVMTLGDKPRLNELPLVLFEQDFAQILRCSVRKVQRLKRARELPEPLPIPGRPRWARDEALRWLAGSTSRGRGRR